MVMGGNETVAAQCLQRYCATGEDDNMADGGDGQLHNDRSSEAVAILCGYAMVAAQQL